MSAVPHITEARALAELRALRAALTRKLNAGDTDAVDRAWDRVTAAEHRLDAVRSQQPVRHIGGDAA